MSEAGQIKRFATLGNHLPRQCGIATFTWCCPRRGYYGAADTSVALAKGSVARILGWLDRHGTT